ncbi:MAG: DUF713 domain-containing protein, partial [Acidobacteria bacterium]|nr:DUF713 domain-containing protein [Acidobacteriota bacterium]
GTAAFDTKLPATGVSKLLTHSGDEFLRLLQKSVSSLHSMLDDVMNLARLQAGHELPDVKPFDAAMLLRDLYENLQLFDVNYFFRPTTIRSSGLVASLRES